MSDGRNILSNFSQLQSLISKKIKKSNFINNKKNSDGFSNRKKPAVSKNNQDNSINNNYPKMIHPQENENGIKIPQYANGKHIFKVRATNLYLNKNIPTLNIEIDFNNHLEYQENQIFGWLCYRFSDCFNYKNKKPLKIGISEDIESAYYKEHLSQIDRSILRNVLRRYVGDRKYLYSIINEKIRFDLNGQPYEDIAKEHIQHTIDKIEYLKEKYNFLNSGGTLKEFYEMKNKEKTDLEKKED